MSHSPLHLLAGLLFALTLVVPTVATGDEPSPTEGIPLPDPSIATQSDAASLEINPAGLGYIHGVEAGYGFFLPTDQYRGAVASGHSLNLGFGSSAAAMGLGVQWMDNPALGTDRRNFRKFTLGGALSPGRTLSMGANLNLFSSRTDERLNDIRTTDLGLQWRPHQAVGLGLLARDVWPAFLEEDQSLPLRLGAGLALRAFEGRLVYETEFHHVSGQDDFELRPRLAAEPIAGIRLFGQGVFGLGVPTEGLNPEFEGFSAGMELSMGTLGVQGARYFGGTDEAGATDAAGMAYRVWTGSPQHKRTLFTPVDRWVKLTVDDRIAERRTTGLFAPPTRSFLNFINDIDAIVEDPGVSGVVFEIGSHQLGHAQLWEFYEAVDRLRDVGKESIAIISAEAPTTGVVYAATAADEVWMRPSSPYGPTGINAELTSYAQLIDQLGIEAEFMRIGEYKSAPEGFVLEEPSEPALEQTTEYLDHLYDTLVERMAERRDLEPQQIRQVIDETPLYPAEALEMGLIDELLYTEEAEERLQQRIDDPLGLEENYRRHEIADQRWGGRPEIAVVYVDGLMVAGESGASPLGGDAVTGAETLTRALRRLRQDNNVKAVVIRIDSPGGSAVAGDVIYRELRHLAAVKPVVASMGNVAASGGYYAAAGADEIVATPVSLTGSIGVYAGKFNIESLADRFGVTTHRENRGERAGVFSPWQPWTDEEREAVAETIEYIYQLFLHQVSDNRPLSPEELDEVGRGRVWTGEAALQRQLTDHEGGISDALRRAEELAGLETGEALYTDRSGDGGSAFSPGMATNTTWIQRLFERILGNDNVAAPDGQLPAALQQLESALLWPLYFDADEPVFLPPMHIDVRE